jgi:hypothetical protein
MYVVVQSNQQGLPGCPAPGLPDGPSVSNEADIRRC